MKDKGRTSDVRIEGPRFAAVPEAVLYDHRLSDGAVRVYATLLRHGESPESCYPSHERIAMLTGKSARSIGRLVVELEAAGWVKRVRRRGTAGGNFTSCGYVVRTVQPFASAQESATASAQESATASAQESATNDSHGNESKKQDPPTPLVPVPAANGTSLVATATFDQFWTTYPRKVAKPAARKAWDRATRTTYPAAIIAGAERYRDDPNREPQFTAHPTTWLNQGRWDDEPIPPRNGGRGSDPLAGRHARPLGQVLAAAMGGGR